MGKLQALSLRHRRFS